MLERRITAKMRLFLVLAAIAVAAIVGSIRAASPDSAEPMFCHDVYFVLKDDLPEVREKLIADCKKYLAGHPGTVAFSVGRIAEEMKGASNERDFGVAMHLLFENKAAYDQYAAAERHLEFKKRANPNLRKVRIFDSYVDRDSP